MPTILHAYMQVCFDLYNQKMESNCANLLTPLQIHYFKNVKKKSIRKSVAGVLRFKKRNCIVDDGYVHVRTASDPSRASVSITEHALSMDCGCDIIILLGLLYMYN